MKGCSGNKAKLKQSNINAEQSKAAQSKAQQRTQHKTKLFKKHPKVILLQVLRQDYQTSKQTSKHAITQTSKQTVEPASKQASR